MIELKCKKCGSENVALLAWSKYKIHARCNICGEDIILYERDLKR